MKTFILENIHIKGTDFTDWWTIVEVPTTEEGEPMSTPSFIGVLYKEGIIKFVYCHSDGYPSYLWQNAS